MTAAVASTVTAEQLVELAHLEHLEQCSRALFDHAHRIVGEIPEGEATDEDLDHITDCYMTWVIAWEAVQAACRR